MSSMMPTPTYTWYPRDFWGGFELFFGAMIGLFIPMDKFIRKNDCASSFLLFGISLADYAKFFDRQFGGM